MGDSDEYGRPGVAGSGTIACGLAACATQTGKVMLLARSDASAWRAEEEAQGIAAKVDGGSPDRVRVTTDPSDLAECDIVIEAIAEDTAAKAEVLASIGEVCPDADLATTTSSLSVLDLGDRSGHSDRLFGLHVFNPVVRMDLVELCLPDRLRDGVRERARAWCRALGKTAIDVPDQSCFVVNRLLFPYLFDAVRLLEQTGMEAADVDACMKLGAGHPMGPLALLDFVGLDVAAAIGTNLHAETGDPRHEVPETIRALIAKERLGRKSDGGFYAYE